MLAHDIGKAAQQIEGLASQFRRAVHELDCEQGAHELRAELALLRMTAISIQEQAHRLKAYVSAAQMAGYVAPQPDRKSLAAGDDTFRLEAEPTTPLPAAHRAVPVSPQTTPP